LKTKNICLLKIKYEKHPQFQIKNKIEVETIAIAISSKVVHVHHIQIRFLLAALDSRAPAADATFC
jgi:hypothetical protein